MLYLTLREGDEVSIGPKRVRVERIFREVAYIKYSGTIYSVNSHTQYIDCGTTIIYKRKKRSAGLFAFDSPHPIRRIQWSGKAH